MSHTNVYPSRGIVSTDVRVTLAQFLEAAQAIPKNDGSAQRPVEMRDSFNMAFLAEAIRQVFNYVNSDGETLENCSKEQAVEALYKAIEILREKGWSSTSAPVLFSRVGIQLPPELVQSASKVTVGSDAMIDAGSAMTIDRENPNEVGGAPRFVM